MCGFVVFLFESASDWLGGVNSYPDVRPEIWPCAETQQRYTLAGKTGGLMKHSATCGVSNRIRTGALCLGAGIAATLLLGATATLIGTTAANAKPEFAAQTGMPCGQCHQNPAGGGKLKAFGEKFKANGNKVPQK